MTKSKSTTKAEQVRRMLTRKNGASLDDICNATDWKPHSVRAFLSGMRKRGYALSREPDASKISRYRITAEPEPKS